MEVSEMTKITDGDGGGALQPAAAAGQLQPEPPSPLTGSYLLVVIGEPHSQAHKDIILQKLAKGFLSWDSARCHVDLEEELAALTEQAPQGEEARHGERLIQYATENLVTEILIQPQINTLVQCMRNLLSSFTRHRHIVHAGYAFQGNGSWILQDGTFSLCDFSEAFQDGDVQRVMRAYPDTVSVDLHCAPAGGWTALPERPFARGCRLRVNPTDVLSSGSPKINAFINYLQPMLIPTDLHTLLESSDVVGNIRFSHPTLYVFPGGQGDAALFGINGFNMLVDGGFARKACFWDFARHLDRLDAVLMTRLNNSNVNGLASVVNRKKSAQVYPQIGHFFCNLQDKKAPQSPDGDKDRDPLMLNLLDQGQNILSDLKCLNLKPQSCYKDSEPINLYHKVGHGTLDMYVLSPAKDAKEVKDFLQKWNNNDQKLFAPKKDAKEFSFPIQNLISICALLVWKPANPADNITRILFPGSTPEHKIFEGLDKIKHLEFMKYPICSAKSLSPSGSLVGLSKQKIKSTAAFIEKMIPETPIPLKSKFIEKDNKVSEEKDFIKSENMDANKQAELSSPSELKDEIKLHKISAHVNESRPKPIKEKKSEPKKIELNRIEHNEKRQDDKGKIDNKNENDKSIKKDNKDETDMKQQKPKPKIEHKSKIDSKSAVNKPRTETKAAKSIDRKSTKVEKKSEVIRSIPTTPKKTADNLKPVNGVAKEKEIAKIKVANKAPLKASPTVPPAKSAKEANNRKVVESKFKSTSSKKEAPKPIEKKEVPKVERKPISRRPKAASPTRTSKTSASPVKSTKSTPSTSVKSDKDSLVTTGKHDKESTNESSPVSTPSVEQETTRKLIDDLSAAPYKSVLDEAKLQELEDLKEEQEVVREIEAVFNRDNDTDGKVDSDAECSKVTDDSKILNTGDVDEEEEYIIIEKEEIEQFTEDSINEQESLTKEEEIQKHQRDSEESEKKRRESFENTSEEMEKKENEIPPILDNMQTKSDTEDMDKDSLAEPEHIMEEEKVIIDQTKHLVLEAANESKTEDCATNESAQLEDDKKNVAEFHDDTVRKDTEEAEDVKDNIEEKNIPTEETAMNLPGVSPDEKAYVTNIKQPDTTEEVKDAEDIVIEENKEQYQQESQPDEKISTTVESGATTAPTLPEDERIPLDEIKEDQVIEEKYVKEETKENEIVENVVSVKHEPVEDIIEKQVYPQSNQIRDVVKTPDEVADLPMHEEVDYGLYEDFPGTHKKKKEDTAQDDKQIKRKDSDEKDKDEAEYDAQNLGNHIQELPDNSNDLKDNENALEKELSIKPELQVQLEPVENMDDNKTSTDIDLKPSITSDQKNLLDNVPKAFNEIENFVNQCIDVSDKPAPTETKIETDIVSKKINNVDAKPEIIIDSTTSLVDTAGAESEKNTQLSLVDQSTLPFTESSVHSQEDEQKKSNGEIKEQVTAKHILALGTSTPLDQLDTDTEEKNIEKSSLEFEVKPEEISTVPDEKLAIKPTSDTEGIVLSKTDEIPTTTTKHEEVPESECDIKKTNEDIENEKTLYKEYSTPCELASNKHSDILSKPTSLPDAPTITSITDLDHRSPDEIAKDMGFEIEKKLDALKNVNEIDTNKLEEPVGNVCLETKDIKTLDTSDDKSKPYQIQDDIRDEHVKQHIETIAQDELSQKRTNLESENIPSEVLQNGTLSNLDNETKTLPVDVKSASNELVNNDVKSSLGANEEKCDEVNLAASDLKDTTEEKLVDNLKYEDRETIKNGSRLEDHEKLDITNIIEDGTINKNKEEKIFDKLNDKDQETRENRSKENDHAKSDITNIIEDDTINKNKEEKIVDNIKDEYQETRENGSKVEVYEKSDIINIIEDGAINKNEEISSVEIHLNEVKCKKSNDVKEDKQLLDSENLDISNKPDNITNEIEEEFNYTTKQPLDFQPFEIKSYTTELRETHITTLDSPIANNITLMEDVGSDFKNLPAKQFTESFLDTERRLYIPETTENTKQCEIFENSQMHSNTILESSNGAIDLDAQKTSSPFLIKSEEEVIKIVANVAEVLKSDKLLEEIIPDVDKKFASPFSSPCLSREKTPEPEVELSGTTEQDILKNEIVNEINSNIKSEVILYNIDKQNVYNEIEELNLTKSKEASKPTSPEPLSLPGDEQSGTVQRMLVTASSEDGGQETEICANGSITFIQNKNENDTNSNTNENLEGKEDNIIENVVPSSTKLTYENNVDELQKQSTQTSSDLRKSPEFDKNEHILQEDNDQKIISGKTTPDIKIDEYVLESDTTVQKISSGNVSGKTTPELKLNTNLEQDGKQSPTQLSPPREIICENLSGRSTPDIKITYEDVLERNSDKSSPALSGRSTPEIKISEFDTETKHSTHASEENEVMKHTKSDAVTTEVKPTLSPGNESPKDSIESVITTVDKDLSLESIRSGKSTPDGSELLIDQKLLVDGKPDQNTTDLKPISHEVEDKSMKIESGRVTPPTAPLSPITKEILAEDKTETVEIIEKEVPAHADITKIMQDRTSSFSTPDLIHQSGKSSPVLNASAQGSSENITKSATSSLEHSSTTGIPTPDMSSSPKPTSPFPKGILPNKDEIHTDIDTHESGKQLIESGISSPMMASRYMEDITDDITDDIVNINDSANKIDVKDLPISEHEFELHCESGKEKESKNVTEKEEREETKEIDTSTVSAANMFSSEISSDVRNTETNIGILEADTIEEKLYSDEEIPESPASITSQIAQYQDSYRFEGAMIDTHKLLYSDTDLTDDPHQLHDSVRLSPSKLDPMSASIYGELPTTTSVIKSESIISTVTASEGDTVSSGFLEEADIEFEKALEEHKHVRGSELMSAITSKYEFSPNDFPSTSESFMNGKSEDMEFKLKDMSTKSKETEANIVPALTNDGLTSQTSAGQSGQGEIPKDFDPLTAWGKPLELPSPAPPMSDNIKTTPKKENKNITAKIKLINEKNLSKDLRRRSESPLKGGKKINPVYIDLSYVPHHGNSYYCHVDFFKRVRARYYVFSGTEPSKEVYNALLEAKQTWEDKDLEVTIIPTYDTDVLGYWVSENEDLLAKYRIDLSPSASRCTINLQDHETSCSAYRLEF